MFAFISHNENFPILPIRVEYLMLALIKQGHALNGTHGLIHVILFEFRELIGINREGQRI